MIIELKFNGTIRDFENAICCMDNDFDFYDTLFWALDYGGARSSHLTEFGEIEIKVKEDEV